MIHKLEEDFSLKTETHQRNKYNWAGQKGTSAWKTGEVVHWRP